MKSTFSFVANIRQYCLFFLISQFCLRKKKRWPLTHINAFISSTVLPISIFANVDHGVYHGVYNGVYHGVYHGVLGDRLCAVRNIRMPLWWRTTMQGT